MKERFPRKAVIQSAGALVAASMVSKEPASAQNAPLGQTLERIKGGSTLVVGARQEAFPFGYLQGNNWMGISTDIAREIHARIEKELGTKVNLKLVAVTSATRIPLLQNGTVDLDAGSTVHTLARDQIVDFSIPFFVTSTELMVHKNSGIKSVADLSGKKVGLPQGSLDIDLFRQKNEAKTWPQPVQVVTYQDQADGFQALLNGAVQAYSTDGILLAGMRSKAKNPDDLAFRQNDSRFRHLVDSTFVDLFENGGYQKLYEKYFGRGGALPFPFNEDLRAMVSINSWPK